MTVDISLIFLLARADVGHVRRPLIARPATPAPFTLSRFCARALVSSHEKSSERSPLSGIVDWPVCETGEFTEGKAF